MTVREQILKSATYAVGKRSEVRGAPEDNFHQIASLWSAYLGAPVQGYQVAHMMMLLKIARSRRAPTDADSWIDAAGYAACGAEAAGIKEADE